LIFQLTIIKKPAEKYIPPNKTFSSPTAYTPIKMNNKSKKRKATGLLDVSDLPIINTKRPIYTSRNDATRPNAKLKALMDQERYKEAGILFQEMVNSNKFKFKNLWQVKQMKKD
jgi:hypothetical protein